MSQHVPAWKRITIKRQQQIPTENHDDDPLNITTHLATGSLTKKQKQKIIRGDDRETMEPIAKKSKDTHASKKKQKLPREERDAKRQTVLKDQLRYLIDFYLSKVKPLGPLPATLHSLESVRTHYPDKFGLESNRASEDEGSSGVVDVWKFSKQKQNWLIKHFFNVEQLPVEYEELLLAYFKELRSPAIKGRVVVICTEKIKQWNDYIESQDEKMKKLVEGKPDENETSAENEETPAHEKEAETPEKVLPEEKATICPDKRIVQRSQQLLKMWRIEPLIELKGFYDETS